MANNLICYEENKIKKWEMIKDADRNNFLLNLLQNSKVDKHSIFIIPCSGFVQGIWLWTDSHKSNRVDFWHFFEEYGTKYEAPEVKEKNKGILQEIYEKNSDDTKYGWISPEGKYFHCNFQGHHSLAYDICFGMVDTDNPDRYLETHGWIKIFKPFYDSKYSIYTESKITDGQMRTLIDMELDTLPEISKFLV